MSHSRAPLVSVIVPVYNRLSLLCETVASLEAQTLDACEFLLVDDRSDFETAAYLRKLPMRDARFRILVKPETMARGCQTSRNLGLDVAQGDGIVFLDSDDLLSHDCLESRHRELTGSPETDILVGRQAIFEESTGALHWVNLPKPDREDLDRFLDLYDPLDVPWVNGGVMIRRARLQEVGVRWSAAYHWDDLAFHMSCLIAGLQSRWMASDGSAPDAYYRFHGDSHYGKTLDTIAGILNSAGMIFWLKEEMERHGRWTPARARSLARSFFHVVILKLVDREEFDHARILLSEARERDLISATQHGALRCYATGRHMTRGKVRATFYWNRLARRSVVRRWFKETPWTYGNQVTPAGCNFPAVSARV